MGFKDALTNLFKPVEDDYDEPDYTPSGHYGGGSYRRSEEPPVDSGRNSYAPAPQATGGYTPRQPSAPVSPLSAVQKKHVAVTTTLDVVKIEPRDFRRDTCTIVDSIRQGCAIVVNTEHTPDELARRILDFVSGGAYALDAQPEKVGEKVYLITPKNVRLLDDPASVIESSEDTY